MANNSELKVMITGDASSAMAALSQFSSSVKAAADQAEGHFSGVAKAVDGLAAPIMKVTALLGGGALFRGAIDGTVTFAKDVGGLQRVLGGTSREASILSVAIGDIYGDTTGFLAGAAKVTKTLSTNEQAIKHLGVATRTANGDWRDTPALIADINAKLAEFGEGTSRNVAAQRVYGKSSQEMLRYIALTPEVLDDARRKVDELGLSMDGEGKAKVKAYRAAMNDMGDVFQALRVRVGLQVMPTLTQLGNWMSGSAPAAIHSMEGALGTARDLLGSTAVQVGLVVWAGNALLPVLGGLAMRIPLVAMATQTWRVQMALAAREGVVGMAAITGAARGTASVLVSMINPWTLVAAGILGGVYAAERWASSASRVAAVSLDLSRQSISTGSAFKELGSRAEELERQIKNSTTSDEQKRKAQGGLRLVLAQLNDIYPGFNRFLVDEKGHQRSIAEAIERANIARERELKLKLAQAETELTAAQIDANADQRLLNSNWFTRNSGIIQEKAKSSQEAVEKLREAVKNYRDALINRAIGEDAGRHWDGPDGAGDNKIQNSYAQDMLRLQKQALDGEQKATLQAQERAEVRKLELQRAEDLLGIQGKLRKGELTPGQAEKVRALVSSNFAQGETAVHARFALQREQLEEDLQGKLLAMEEGGLEKRLEAIRKTYVQIRQINANLAVDGKAKSSEEEISAAQAAAVARAKKDQVQADLEKLKKELSELAQINGGKLGDADTEEILARYRAQGGTRADAAKKYSAENHIGETGTQGALAGMEQFLAQSENSFAKWKNVTVSIIGGTQNAFSGFFGSLLQHGMTAGQKWDALWKGIAGSTVKALSDMASQELVHLGVQKIKAAWESMAAAKKMAQDKALVASKVSSEAGKVAAMNAGAAGGAAADAVATASSVEAATIQTGAAESTMAAKIYAWYASMGPWAIPAAAATVAAAIVAIQAIGKVTAREKGGIIGLNGPEFFLGGERGPEVIAPPSDFRDWAQANQNLGYNLGAHQAQISRLQAQASSYAAGAPIQAAAAPRDGGGTHIHVHGDVYTQDSREFRRAVYKGQAGYLANKG